MTKYKKRNVTAKKMKQGSKEYATEDKTNMYGNIHQLSSSEDTKSYEEGTASQDSSEILEKSGYTNFIPMEIKQSEDYAGSIKNLNVKSEESKPLLVRGSSTSDSINYSDTNIARNNSFSVVPSTYGDRGQLTTNPFLATMSLWQNFFIAWLRMCNEFFRYPAISPTTIRGYLFYFETLRNESDSC
ncbi:MAG: hypothetical protein WBZ36_08455 [Candidatus Nitrosopolaris sp.]